MRRLIKTALLPAVLLAGLAIADSPTAQAAGPFGPARLARGPFVASPMAAVRARRAARSTTVHHTVHHVVPVTYVSPTVVTHRVPVVTRPIVVNPVVTHRVTYPVAIPTSTTYHATYTPTVYSSYYVGY